MTDTPSDNNSAAVQEAQPEQQVQLRVLTQYVRDLSFENPTPMVAQNQRPNINVNVGVNAGKGEVDNQYLVTLKVTASAKVEDKDAFVAECDYAGTFLIENAQPQMLQPLLLIECPRILFPFVRRVIADVTRDGGYPPLMIDPVDFVGLYQQQMKAMQEQPVGDA